MNEAARMERFTERIPEAGCWIWTGSLSGSGYGRIQFHGRLTDAHRAAWILAKGSIPAGMFVCHSCDVKTCINPAHLFLGSPLDNMRDMIAKGRDRYGRQKQATQLRMLTDEEARAVIASALSFAQLAKQFGVSRSTIQHIKQRRTYRHL